MSPTTAGPQRVTAERDVDFYERVGWYLSDIVISEEDIAACREAAARIYQCDYDHIQPWCDSPHIKNFRTEYRDRTQLRVDQFPSFYNDAIRKVVHSPEIAAVTATLLRTEEVRYYKDILIGTPACGPGSNSSIGWHTDVSYWPTCVPKHMITIYVPLQERDERNGTLLMINGSHRWTARPLNLTATFDEIDKIRQRYEKSGYAVELEPIRHKKGQVSFHSSLVIHATYPNQTEEFQHSLVFGQQAKENRFVPSPLKRLNKSLVINLNDEIGPRLPDGTPDLRDPAFYPVLYSRKGPEASDEG